MAHIFFVTIIAHMIPEKIKLLFLRIKNKLY